MLIDHGANVNARKYDYWTPIHVSAYNGLLGIVELLLERGADTSIKDDDGRTAYQLALRQGHRKVADLLRDHVRRGA
jgi:ankyrin repeat protein